MDGNRRKKQNKVLSYIKYIFSDSIHAKRNAWIQILIATVAFIMLVQIFPMGSIQNHTYSKQGAFDKVSRKAFGGDVFTASDKKLQTVYFEREHLYRITLYMQCMTAKDFLVSKSVLFRLYDDGFSCIYEEEISNKKIEKNGFLTATPDLDVELDSPYYYEILVDEESNAVYKLPVADKDKLAQKENGILYIDGIINDTVCLVADFDYTRPLTAVGIIAYYFLIITVALIVYVLVLILIQKYDKQLSQYAEQISKYIRLGTAAVSVLVSLALVVYAVILNRFGGELWDRLFFTAGIGIAEAWIIGFLWRKTRVLRPKKSSKMSASNIICLMWRDYIQTVSFGLLFYALCQYVNADREFYHYTNTRWMLIFLAVALLMNYNERRFVNKFSAIWLAIGFIGSIMYCKGAKTDDNTLLLARLTCGVVVSWGLLILNIFLDVVRTKDISVQNFGDRLSRQIKENKRKFAYIVLWFVFCLLMYINRYEKVWVFTATLPFVAVLFAPNTLSAKCRFLRNFGNGILLSFAMVTVFCLAHRPHHYWMLYRYGGMFHTVACTGMYLAIVFGTAMAKLYGKLKTRKSIFLFCYPEYFVTACSFGFILLTMSRTAFLTTLVTVTAIVGLTGAAYRKDIKRIFSEIGVLTAVCLCSFPMVFTAVRMVPAVINDPVRYDIEFQDKTFMVYEGDPIDSDKYMTVRRFFNTLFGRFQTEEQKDNTEVIDFMELTWLETGELAYMSNNLAGLEMQWFYGQGDSADTIDEEDKNDISNGRFEIFKDYMMTIGFKGHPKMGPEDKNGDEYAHAHNSYLQVAYNFGLIAGIVFLVLCVLTLWHSIRFFLDYGNKYSTVLIPFAAIVVFGFISLTEWAYHPCIPAGFSFILMQVLLMRDCKDARTVKRGTAYGK